MATTEEIIKNDTLHEIRLLGDVLAQNKQEIENLEAIIRRKKAIIQDIEERKLPDMMDVIGIEEITLQNGHKITLKDFVHAKLSDADTALQWLLDTNNTGIVKNSVTVSIPYDQQETLMQLLEQLQMQGHAIEHKATIHPSTLKSFCREALDNPKLSPTLPRKAFGIYEGRKVEFK